jgi:hypothetical protein
VDGKKAAGQEEEEAEAQEAGGLEVLASFVVQIPESSQISSFHNNGTWNILQTSMMNDQSARSSESRGTIFPS